MRARAGTTGSAHAGVHGAKLEERYTFSDTTDALSAAALGLGAALARERIAEP